MLLRVLEILTFSDGMHKMQTLSKLIFNLMESHRLQPLRIQLFDEIFCLLGHLDELMRKWKNIGLSIRELNGLLYMHIQIFFPLIVLSFTCSQSYKIKTHQLPKKKQFLLSFYYLRKKKRTYCLLEKFDFQLL